MINEEKVILMTRMASYEQNEGKRNVVIGSYFRNDYIGYQVLKSIISATIAFVIAFSMFIFYDFESFMQEIYQMNLMEFGRAVLIRYLETVFLYGAISYVVYARRYTKAKVSLKRYYNNLKKLAGFYNR